MTRLLHGYVGYINLSYKEATMVKSEIKTCVNSFVFVNLSDLVQYMSRLEEADIPKEVVQIAVSWRHSHRTTQEEIEYAKQLLEEAINKKGEDLLG